MKTILKILGRILAAILALIVCTLLLMLVLPLTETGDRTPVPGSADWMAELPDDRLLSEIHIPGTHDSGTQYVQLAFFSKCQALSIREQLEAGFRYLDIRLGVDEKDGVFQLDVLAGCYDFLDAHPTETVVFAVKQEHGDQIVRVFEETLDAHVQDQESRWLVTDTVPTLGEARGKLVLLRRYEDAANLGERAGIPFLWASQNGSSDTKLNAVCEDNGSYSLWVQDRYEFGAEDKWNAFTAGMDAARDRVPGDVAVHFLSTKGTLPYGHPYHFAKTLNRRLMEANLALDGWVIVDFASAPIAERIYSTNLY